MEFIKIKEDRYLIKDSNNYIVSKKEMLELQKKELVLKDISSNQCQKDTTEKIIEIEKEIKVEDNGTNVIKKTTKPIKRHNKQR